MRVQLNGYVTSDEVAGLYRRWGYTGVCCPTDVRQAIESCPEGEELIFEINSGGGSVYSGFEMYTLLRGAGRETVAEVQSVAGSAASVIMAGCSLVRISPVGNIMIHRASSWADGNEETMRQTRQMLRTIDESILNAYEQKTGDKCSRERLKGMMERETFFTADEAIAVGLADEKLFDAGKPEDGTYLQAVASMNEGLCRAVAGLPPLEELKELMGEKDLLHPEGAEDKKQPEKKGVDSMDWTLENLQAEAPELLQQIQTAARGAERARLKGIAEMALPGYEDILDAARENPEATAESVAAEIVRRQKKQGGEYLENRGKDAANSGVNGVPANAGGGEEPTDAEKLDKLLDSALGPEK